VNFGALNTLYAIQIETIGTPARSPSTIRPEFGKTSRLAILVEILFHCSLLFEVVIARAMPLVRWRKDMVCLLSSRTVQQRQGCLTMATQQKRREFITGATAGHHSGMKFAVMFISATVSRFA